MKAKIIKPVRVNCLGGEVEVTEQEFERLLVLDAVDPLEVRETPEVEKKVTRKAKK